MPVGLEALGRTPASQSRPRKSHKHEEILPETGFDVLPAVSGRRATFHGSFPMGLGRLCSTIRDPMKVLSAPIPSCVFLAPDHRVFTEIQRISGGRVGPPKPCTDYEPSGGRAGFRPDYNRESLNIGSPAGHRPSGGQILRLSRLESGRHAARKPDFWPGSIIA